MALSDSLMSREGSGCKQMNRRSSLCRPAFSFAKLKRCRVMEVVRLVATSTIRDGTISGPVVVLTPGGAVISHHPKTT
jgi:hypothetical protein